MAHRALAAGLAAAAIAALLVRCVSVAEPLGIDQSLWASAVRGMSRGQLLYRDVWEQRPPGIYWIYLTGFRLFGWQQGTVAVLDILAAASTTLFLFLIGRAVSATLAGLVAAALYATMTMPAWLYRHGGFLERSVCETFISVAVAAAVMCAVSWRSRRHSSRAFGVGLFAGAAVILKPNAGLYLLAALAWMHLYGRPHIEPRRTRLGALGPLAIACAAAAVLPAIAIIWLWRLGILHDAKIAVVDFNRFYVSQGFTVAGYAVDFSRAVWLRTRSEGLWLAGVIGAIAVLVRLARARAISPLAGLALLWGAAAVLVIVVNGARLFNSYFIQAQPPLALMGAWLFAEAGTGARWHKALAAAAGVMMIAVTLQRHYPAKILESASSDFASLRGRIDRAAYLDLFGGYQNQRGYSARANEELAAYVRAHTTADERVYLFGINGAGVYFLADRLTAHRFLRVNFFVPAEFPDPSFTLGAVTRELAEREPRYIIFERLNSRSEMGQAVDRLPSTPEVGEMLKRYRQDAEIEDFTLFRRID